MPSISVSAPPQSLTFKTSGSIREEDGGESSMSAYGLQSQQERFGTFREVRCGWAGTGTYVGGIGWGEVSGECEDGWEFGGEG